MSKVSEGLQEEARDELLCEIDHWKLRAIESGGLLEACLRHLGHVGLGDLPACKSARAFLDKR